MPTKAPAKKAPKKAAPAKAVSAAPAMLREPRLIRMDMGAIKPWAGNPRDHGAEQLRLLGKSLDAYGLVALPVVQAGTGRLIAGHGRLEALKAAGKHGSIPVLEVDLTDEEATGYAIADNRLTDLSTWNLPALKEAIADLDDGSFDLELTGFDLGTLEGLFGETPGGPRLTGDPDSAPPLPKTPVTKLGDLLILGEHRVICGDSTSVAVWDRLMGTELADLVVTDPPYGMTYESKVHGAVKNDDLGAQALEGFLLSCFRCMRGAAVDRAAWYVWHSYHRQREFQNAMEKAGLRLKSQIIWVKPSAGLGMDEFRRRHENAFVGEDAAVPSGLIVETHEQIGYGVHPDQKPEWNGGRTQTTVWEQGRDAAANLVHPTQKPVELITKALLLSSKPGQLVIDGFGGSGSTLIACHQARRRARCVELDPGFCDVIATRFENLTGIKAVRVAAGKKVPA